MRDILHIFIKLAILYIVAYAIAAFTLWDLNPADWYTLARLLAIVVPLGLLMADDDAAE